MKTIMKHDLLTTLAICRFNSINAMYGVKSKKPLVKKGSSISEETRVNLLKLAGGTLHSQLNPSPEK